MSGPAISNPHAQWLMHSLAEKQQEPTQPIADLVFILYSATTPETIDKRLGSPEYSYFFVRELFRAMLQKRGTTIVVTDPAREVDAIYERCRAAGHPCVFLSFAPPHRSILNLRCPTIPVFAWEFSRIPDEAWDNDARNDWRMVLAHYGQAITHSQYSADAVCRAMGQDFPVIAVPAPQWDVSQARERADLFARPDVELLVHHTIDTANLDISVLNEIEWQHRHSMNMPSKGFSRHLHRTKRSLRKRFHARSPASTSNKSGPGKSLRLKSNDVVFTSVFSPHDGRKNWVDMVTAFSVACAEHPDAILILKLVSADRNWAFAEIGPLLQRLPPHQCRIVAIADFLDANDYSTLVDCTTFAVNTSLCEGQCLPLMEFMSRGKPAIAPNHTGMAEYVNDQVAIVLNTGIEICSWPQDIRGLLRTYRYRNDWGSIAQAFRRAYQLVREQPDRYLEMSRRAAMQLQDFCSEDVVWMRLESFIAAALGRHVNADHRPELK